MILRTRILAVATCAFLAAGMTMAPSASAAPPAKGAASEAAQRKKEGDEAFLALRYADALRAYEASYKLAANPALHFNRGRSLEALERYAEALEAFDSFLREAPPDIRAKAGNLVEHMAELRRKITIVRLTITPAGARILLRDVAVGTAPLTKPLRVNSGPARLEVDADGYQAATRTVELPPGGEVSFTFDLEPKSSTSATASPTRDPSGATATTTDSPPKSKSVLTRWWFWTGAAVIIGGAVAATYVLTRPNEPKKGDLGQLAAPLLRF